MDFEHKNVVVLGGTGTVGSGAVQAFLARGATVVVVSRTSGALAKLEKLLDLAALPKEYHLLEAIGEFNSEENAQSARRAVADILDNKPVHHVVASLGYAKTFQTGPTGCSLSDLHAGLEEGLTTSFLAAKVFLPELKTVAGSSYTIVSGGLAHIVPAQGFWNASVKSAAVNALALGLIKECEGTQVAVNCACIHFGVAPHGGKTNAWGMPATDTYELGKLFVWLTEHKREGQILDLETGEQVAKMIA